MTKTRLMLVVLAGAALVTFYRAGEPVAVPTDEEAPRLAQVRAVPPRVYDGMGMVGARIVAPAVRRMVADTEDGLLLIRQDLRGAQLTQSQRSGVLSGIAAVGRMDSLALAGLAEGRPVTAFQQAMQASGLSRAVQENVRGAGD
jgi:hypothetical protein